MRTRICIFFALFFCLFTLSTVQVKANDKGNPDHNSDKHQDKKDGNNDTALPINTALGSLLIAGLGIGIIAIKKAKSAVKTV